MHDEDPYFDDANGVLFNKHGITDSEKLRQVEEDLSLARIDELRQNPIEGQFDESHLNAIHEHIFQDTYEFAGHSRLETGWDPTKYEEVLEMQSVDYPTCYAEYPGEDLKSVLEDTFDNLRAENYLQGQSQEQFIERLAEHTTAVWQAHSFREGNTRTTCEFVYQLAKEAGHELPQDFPADKKEFRNALALATTGENERLLTQMTKAVAPIEKAELAIHSLTEELVQRELSEKSISHSFDSNSTAESKYIDKALDNVQHAKETVANRVASELPFEHRRIELEKDINAEIDNFNKTVELNKEHQRITLAQEVAKHENADISTINELKRQANENQKELIEHMSESEPLTSDRLDQAMTIAKDYRDELEFDGNSSDDLTKPHLRAGTGELNQNSELSSASRFISSERKMVTNHIESDLAEKAKSITKESTQKTFKENISIEKEKRTYAIRKAVNNKYPKQTALSNELKTEQQTRNNYAELKHLVNKNNELTSSDFQSMSKQRANDNQIVYLTNKIENEPSASKTLSKTQQQTVQKSKEVSVKRQTQERESGIEL